MQWVSLTTTLTNDKTSTNTQACEGPLAIIVMLVRLHLNTLFSLLFGPNRIFGTTLISIAGSIANVIIIENL